MGNGSSTERLRQITLQAAELAALVPEDLRQAAFERNYEQLLLEGESGQEQERDRGRQRAGKRQRPRSSSSRRTPPTSGDKETGTGSGTDPVTHLMSNLSRTDHPEIGQASKALDRALHMLRIAERDHGIDGLTAGQLAKVLTDKFRLRVSRQALNQALDAAGDYVDRVPTGKGTIYRVMEPGEQYLDAGGADADENTGNKSPPQRRTRRGVAKRAAAAPKEAEAKSGGSTSRRRSSRGPKALVEGLIGDDFFSEPRTIGDIQERLRHKKGVTLKASDLSPAMVRLLRESKLDRERNEDGQYEYSVPS